MGWGLSIVPFDTRSIRDESGFKLSARGCWEFPLSWDTFRNNESIQARHVLLYDHYYAPFHVICHHLQHAFWLLGSCLLKHSVEHIHVPLNGIWWVFLHNHVSSWQRGLCFHIRSLRLHLHVCDNQHVHRYSHAHLRQATRAENVPQPGHGPTLLERDQDKNFQHFQSTFLQEYRAKG